jgi:hypothetical protein
MPFIPCDTTPHHAPIKTITDEDLHLLIDDEIQRIPFFHGAFTLYDNRGAIFVDTGTLRNVVPVAAAKHPTATHFSLHGLTLTHHRSTEQLAERLKQTHGLDNPINKEPIGFRK